MFILLGAIIYLNRKHSKEIKEKNQKIYEQEKELEKIRQEKFDLKMDLLSSNTGKDFSYLKYNKEDK